MEATMKTIKQHGMLYIAAMVQAILRLVDPKTMTRRNITFHNSTTDGLVSRKDWKDLRWEEAWLDESGPSPAGNPGPYWHVPFRDIVVRVYPRVRPGDIIWVKEVWQVMRRHFSLWQPGKYITCHGMPMKEKPVYQHKVVFKADDTVQSSDQSFCWRSSMLMPRWASRIDLDVLKVGTQRIQDISENDAKEEGAKMVPWYVPHGCTDEGQHRHVNGREALISGPMACYRNGFATLWDSINAAKGFGWDVNHPVWIYEFKRVKP
jgi:hypothetical protein